MDSTAYFEEKRKYSRYSVRLPLEYWQTDDVCRGGIVENLGEEGLLTHSVYDMSVGEKLNIRIFFPNGFEFDGIRIVGKIVWKDHHNETDWKGYQYGVEFVLTSEEDRQKLDDLLRSPSILEENPSGEDTEADHPSLEKSVSSAKPIPSPNSQPMKETSGKVFSKEAFSPTRNKELLYWRDVIQ